MVLENLEDQAMNLFVQRSIRTLGLHQMKAAREIMHRIDV